MELYDGGINEARDNSRIRVSILKYFWQEIDYNDWFFKIMGIKTTFDVTAL